MTLKTRIEEIADDYFICECPTVGGVLKCECPEVKIQFISDILKAVKKSLPEKKTTVYYPDRQNWEGHFYNQAIDDMYAGI